MRGKFDLFPLHPDDVEMSSYRAGNPSPVTEIVWTGEVDLQAENGPLLAATREALVDLAGEVTEIATSVPAEGTRAVLFLQDRLSVVLDQLNRMLGATKQLGRAVGDSALAIEKGSLLQLVLKTREEAGGLRTAIDDLKKEFDELDAGMTTLEDDVGKEILKSGQMVLGLVSTLSQRLQAVESSQFTGAPPAQAFPPSPAAAGAIPGMMAGGAPIPPAQTMGGVFPVPPGQTTQFGTRGGAFPVPPTATYGQAGAEFGRHPTANLPSPLPHDLAFTNAAGAISFTFDDLVREIVSWRNERSQMEARIVKLEADVVAQGGVVFDHSSYSSEQEIKNLVLREDPQGSAIAAFVTPLTIFSHDNNFVPAKGWRDTVKAELKTGGFTAAEGKFLCAATQRLPSWYAGTGEVVAGKLLSAFTTMDGWKGRGGIIGQKGVIAASARTAKGNLTTYINQKLPSGSELAGLAVDMANATQSWLSTVHSFFNDDLAELQELGVSPEESLTLISEYTILMYDVFYLHSQKLIQFSLEVDRSDYLSRVIWVSLLIQQEMARFTQTEKMKHHPTLSNAFIRFLTKATAANSSAGIAKRLAALEKTGGPAKQAQEDAKKAKAMANKTQDELTKLREEVTRMKKDK